MTEVWAAIIGVVITFVITFLIGWGFHKAKAAELERRVRHLERSLSDADRLLSETREYFSNQLHNLKDSYIGFKHFDEAMGMMKENYRDLKNDVSKVLNLLSER